MAQLRDTVVSGSLRATDTIYSTTNQFQILRIPTASNGTTYGPGTNGQILKSNGTSVYWASDNNSDTNVTQAAAITTAGAYPIILANSTATSAVTGAVNKTSTLTYNPSTKALVTGGTVDGYTLAAASAKAVTDSSSASAIGTGTSLPTERDIYYGLPTINNAHNYTSSTKIYAPTSGGTSGQFLKAQGETSTPEWANIITTDITSIKKIYTNFYSTATDDNGRTAFCFKITRPNATTVWHIKFKVHATIPNHLEYASMDWDIDYYGYGNNEKAHYAKVNPGATYAIRYLVNAYPTSASDNIVLMGFQLYSNNETSTDYARTVEVSLIDYDNCTIEFLDNLIRQSSITISNYTRRSIDLYAAGFQETSDSNSGYVTTSSNTNSFLAGSTPVYKYSLFMLKSDGTVASIVTSEGQGTTKQKNTSGFVPGMIWYNWSSANIAANGRVVYTASHEQLDFRYSSNCGTTLTAGKPVYIVGTIGADGLFYLDDDIYTQTLPTAVDNKVYMFVGTALAANGYQILFLETHPVYQYKNNGIQEYVRDAATINGLTVKTAVPENALFTDTTYESKAAASNGTAVSLVTTGEKYIWNQTSNNTVLNSSTGTKGDIIYWSAANTPARLGANTTTTPKYLCMTSSAPVWQEIIPTSNLDLTAITTAEIDAIITGNSSGTLTVPTSTSQLTNDSNFLVNTNNVINLNSYGAAIGMTSTSTSSAKKFEVNSNYTSYLNGPVYVAGIATFSGGITGVTNYVEGETLTGGTWIDGKPIYRYVKAANINFATSVTLFTMPNLPETVIRIDMVMMTGTSAQPVCYSYYGNENWETNVSINCTTGEVVVQAGSSARTNHDYIIIIEYTRGD